MRIGNTARTAAIIGSLLLISTLLHTQWCGTPFRLSEETWQKMVAYHSDNYPFNIRLLTTPTVNAIHVLTGFSLKLSFGLLQLALGLLLGVSFSRLLGHLDLKSPWREIGLASLILAYPLFFAVSEPMHTWDDIWGYLFLTLCTSAVVRAKPYAAGMWFLAACFAREQTLIYFPLYAAGVYVMNDHTRRIRAIIAIFLPLVIFGTFLILVWQQPDSNRLQLLLFNFDGILRTRDSLYSIFMAFGWLWVGWILALRWRTKTGSPYRYHGFLKIATLYAVPVTVLFAAGLTLVRETRILFPPAVLVIPFVMRYVQERLAVLDYQLREKRRLMMTILVSLVLLGIGIWLGHLVFPTFEYRSCPDFSRLWAGVQFGLSFCLIWLLSLARSARGALGESLK